MATHIPISNLHLVFIFLALPSQLGILASDVQALLEFKKGIRHDPSGRLATWSHPLDATPGGACPLDFTGVSCDDSGNVVSLELVSLGLAGELKLSTISSLQSLRRLSLAGNSLSGRLPPALGLLTSLVHLDLSGNRFYGPVPGRMFDLSSLVHLNLSHNSFSGGFPSGMQNLQQLKFLDLRGNSFMGDAGALLSELRSPEHVDLSGNFFGGGLPGGLSAVAGLASNVKYVNLSYNRISGGFFSGDSMQLFKSLEVLDVSWNQINGKLPPFEALTNLRVLRVMSNQLYGSVPERLLGNVMPLVELDLSRNGFSGYVQDINSTTLKTLNLSSNFLSGTLPSSIGVCISLDVSNNRIVGDLLVMKNWRDTLEVMDLSSNALSGSFPHEAFLFGNLLSLNLRNNSLAGPLPAVFEDHTKLSIIDLSLNDFTGPISQHLFASLTLTSLNLSGNHFSGSLLIQSANSLETLILPSYNRLESLDLSDNLLSGLLPLEIGKMESLKLLNLGLNSFSGELPSEISKLSNLEYLDLSNNHFEGTIPDMPQSTLKALNVSYNNLSGKVPVNLRRFKVASFFPGNPLLVFSDTMPAGGNSGLMNSPNHASKANMRIAVIVGSIGAVMFFALTILAFYVMRSQEFCGNIGFGGQSARRDVHFARLCGWSMKPANDDTVVTATPNFSNDHLLTSTATTMSAQKESLTGTIQYAYSDSQENGLVSMKTNMYEQGPSTMARNSSPGSPLSSLNLTDSRISEQPVLLNVHSPDRFSGELFFMDKSLAFTAEELSRAPAEILGRSNHGTSYKATLNGGHMLTVKWFRVGLVKSKKEFVKETKRIGAIRHPNIISSKGYYWGPRDQERLIVSDYIVGDSLALYLHESTPRRYSQLSVNQRLRIAVDMARALHHLHHDKRMAHGNLKPTNILLTGPGLTARLADFGLHRLMTPNGTSDQMLNLGALGYRAPELVETTKPFPSFKADVYAFGVILMEMLTRRSAGDVVSGQSGAVDLTDWVRLYARDGRGDFCFDRDIVGLEESPSTMDGMLAVSLRCVLPVDERPNIKEVFDDLCSLTM